MLMTSDRCYWNSKKLKKKCSSTAKLTINKEKMKAPIETNLPWELNMTTEALHLELRNQLPANSSRRDQVYSGILQI